MGKFVYDYTFALLEGRILRQTQLGSDESIVFANSAAVDTQNTITIAAPEAPQEEHEIIVHNPSTVTDLTVKVFNVELALGGATRDALVTTLNIPKSQAVTGTTINTHARFINSGFNGGDLKLVISNDTVLGLSDGFAASVRIREV
jgi:hypothetical protein